LKTSLALLLVLSAHLALAAGAAAGSSLTPDGSTMVAWGDLNVRLIAPDGVPEPTIYDLDPEAPAAGREVSDPFWAMAPDGTATFAWIEIAGTGIFLRERQAAADGSPLGPIHTLATSFEEHARVDVDVAADGTATVVWNEGVTGEIFARRIAPDGTPAESTLLLDPGGPSGHWPDLAVAPDGTATVVWVGKEGEGNALRTRQIDADGLLGPIQTLGTSSFGMGEPEVGVAADGTATALWTQWASTGPEHLLERQLSPTGTIGSLNELDEEARFPKLFVGAAGNPLIAWTTADDEFVARQVEPGGALSPTVVTLHNEEFAPFPQIGVAADGTYTIAWVSEPCGPRSCVLERRLQPDGTLGALNVVSESAAIQGAWETTVGGDGSATVVYTKQLRPGSGAYTVEARKLEADGSLNPQAYLVSAPDTRPTFALPFGLHSLDFGTVDVGSQRIESILVTSVYVEPQPGFSATIAGPDADQFSLPGGTCSPTLAAYPHQCTVEVAFAPTRAGKAEATLVLGSGAGREPVELALLGSGALAPAHGEPPSPPGPPAGVPGQGPPPHTGPGTHPHPHPKHRRAKRLKHGRSLHFRSAHRRGR
jgi:hypothetical protein